MATPSRSGRARSIAAIVAGLVVMAAGWLAATAASTDATLFSGVFVARYTDTPIRIDGRLDDAAWRQAAPYHLVQAQSSTAKGQRLAEHGTVRLAWDDQRLYVAVAFDDSDIVAEGQEDQLPHFQLGDLVEVFLKPEASSWYWELYATPLGKKSCFWFPGRGRLGLPSNAGGCACGLSVAAQCSGTLNRWQDRDARWTAEMAVPVKDLTAHGDAFRPGAAWRILVARYNYSRYLPWRELSTAPQLSEPNNHLHEQYASLVLRR